MEHVEFWIWSHKQHLWNSHLGWKWKALGDKAWRLPHPQAECHLRRQGELGRLPLLLGFALPCYWGGATVHAFPGHLGFLPCNVLAHGLHYFLWLIPHSPEEETKVEKSHGLHEIIENHVTYYTYCSRPTCWTQFKVIGKSVIPASWETEIGRITVGGQPGQKVSKTPSEQISQAWWPHL
jgi:hypothetical protein